MLSLNYIHLAYLVGARHLAADQAFVRIRILAGLPAFAEEEVDLVGEVCGGSLVSESASPGMRSSLRIVS